MAKLNIMICTHGPHTTPLMNGVLRSLLHQTYTDFKVLSASSGEHVPQFETDLIESSLNANHWHLTDKKHFPEKIEFLYSQIDSDCEYVALFNDDVILNKDCLKQMIMWLDISLENKKPVVLQAMSNCDLGKLYLRHQILEKDGKGLTLNGPQYRLKEITPDIRDHIIHGNYLADSNLFYVPWVSFYCTVMSKDSYEKIGGIDPRFKTGQDDLDFSIRANKLGIKTAVTSSAFCFHYSGITADTELTKEEREFNLSLFDQKHKGEVQLIC